MDFSKTYSTKVANHNAKIKDINLPLISFDIHLRNLYKKSLVQKDLKSLAKMHPDIDISEEIMKEYLLNEAVLIITDLYFKIEFASTNIVQMTGYKPAEILGKSPKIFQGIQTNKTINKKIRDCVSKKIPFHYVIINYKKDNTTYNCDIKGYPLKNAEGQVVKYIAVEKEVA